MLAGNDDFEQDLCRNIGQMLERIKAEVSRSAENTCRDVHVAFQPRNGGRMPPGVYAYTGHPRFLGRDLHCPQDVAWVDRGAEIGCEDQVGVVPLVTGRHALGILCGAAGLQQVN